MTAAAPRILIAGVGNIFLGDDGFGVEVAQRLAGRPWPPNVRVTDFGIRGLDLTYALLEPCDAVVLVDAAARGHPPGTLSVIEPDPKDLGPTAPGEVTIDTHSMDPVKVLGLVRAMGGEVRRLLVVACEPQPLNPDEEMWLGLSPPAQAAVHEAVRMIESLVAGILGGEVAPAAGNTTGAAACTSSPLP